jgi:hypothetical protein
LRHHIEHIVARKHGGPTRRKTLRWPATAATCIRGQISRASIR